jgi:hypothetical protein
LDTPRGHFRSSPKQRTRFGRLHYVLDAINDSESPDLVDETDVTGVDLAFFVDHFFRGFWVYFEAGRR